MIAQFGPLLFRTSRIAMKHGGENPRDSKTRPAAWATLALLGGLLSSGCVSHKPRLDVAHISHNDPRYAGVVEHYQVGCPDVLHVEFDEQEALDGEYVVGAEGRITLKEYGP